MRRLICVYLAVALSCRGNTPTTTPGKPLSPSTSSVTTQAPATAGGRRTVAIDTKLVSGSVSVELVDGVPPSSPAVTAELTPNETKALLARLEPLPDLSAQNAKAPAMRAPSPPPPRAGSVQPIAFAVVRGKLAGDMPDAAAPRPTPAPPAPLAKPEISPTGVVEKENEIRIRFSDAMVPVAAVGASDKPVATITPAVAGAWRWIDTRVATFTAKGAYFGNATEYVVTVPAGVKSLTGSILGEPVEQRFQTRTLTVTGTFPTTTLRPDSAVAVQFDQGFDPKAIEKKLRVIHAKRALPFRVVSREEAEKSWRLNPSIAFGAAELPKLLGKHHMFLAPVGTWPAGARPQIELAAKAPSTEGPLLSDRATHTSFEVARPFQVAGMVCNASEKARMTGEACPALSYVNLQFTNTLSRYRSSQIQIEGAEFEDHSASGNSVSLLVPDGVGKTRHVAITGELFDIYGQPLTGPRRPTFTVVRQRFEAFVQAPSGLVVLDPRWEIPQWVVTAEAVTALHVQLFAVKPSDYLAYEAFERKERATPPGKLVFDKFYPVGARHGANLRTDLRPHLGASTTGHLIAVVHAQPATPHRAWTPKTAAWIEVTRLGTSARIDGDHVNAFVQDISPVQGMKPIDKANVTLVVEGRSETSTAATDASGHVELDLLAAKPWPNKQRLPTVLLQVATNDDSMFTPFRGNHERAQRTREARWYVTDDRFIYKPGETVYLKGWVRWTHSGLNPDLALPAPTDTIAYTLTDNRGNKLASGDLPVSDAGGFDLELALPANANQGGATFTFATNHAAAIRHPIQIQEFRRPAYAVNLDEDVTHSGATHLVLGEAIEMQARAKYYAGGGLPGANIEWRAELAAATYAPPGWSAYTFNPRKRDPSRGAFEVTKPHLLSGDSSSTAVFGIAQVVVAQPSVLTVDATVTDVDRMTIRASSRPILVHPSTLYVGSRLAPRTHDILEVIVTDIDGNPVAGVPVDVQIEAVLGSERGRDDAKIVDTQHCKLTSETKPITCKVQRKNIEWSYSTVATVRDARQRTSFTAFELPWFNWQRDDELVIVPDKKSYRPGDVAKLEIKSKQLPAIALLSFARQGVIAQQRIELKTASTIVELPIQPGFLQNVHVLVDRWADRRYQNGGKAKLQEIVSTQIDLPVEVESARLNMRTRALKTLVEPGDKATFEVEVTHEGKPKANAEVALIVVDEAVLALSGKSHADPLAPFYREVRHGTSQFDSLDLVRDDGAWLGQQPGFERFSLDELGRSGFGAGGGGTGWGTIGSGRYGTIGHGSGTGIVVSRKDFRATAAFSPRLETDANGKVRLTVTMPDSLTRFRIVALATADTRWFGKAESAIVTQRKVNARTVAPRFLSQGDRFSLPVVVQNLDAAPRTIDVAARATNLVAVGPAGKRVTLQGGQRAEVRFDFTTENRGKAVVQTIAVSGEFADASNMEIPIYEPATTESFATYGVVDDAPKFERLEVPAEIFTDVGGVEVELASTQLQSLTDAYWYLYAYPYECAEQRSSRMIATTAMADILDAFATPGRPSKQEIQTQVADDLKKLAKDQNKDGGWGYFDGMKSDPFVTAQVLIALDGHISKVPPAVLAKATKYVIAQANAVVGKLEAAAAKQSIDRKDRSQHAYWISLAAATFTALSAANIDTRARAERLHATATALTTYPIDAKARLLSLVAKLDRAKPMRQKLLADLISATRETAAAATVTTAYEEAERPVLVSNNKTTALALDAIMREAPEHAVVTKLARGVLDARNRGRWASTQENLVVLQTMRRYFDTYEKETPNYTGKLWFGAAAYTEQTFAGRSTVRGVAQVEWDRLPAKSGHDLALQKTGPGRMYYRVGITYAPKNVNLPALDAGFLVRRRYAAIDNPADVQKLPDGRIKVRLGARVRVTLETLTTTRRHAVALVDPLPAGFEAVNEALAISERTVSVQDDSHWDFRAQRDTRVEVFRMELEEGRHQYTYTARATTPGTFLAAPTKAEEMYSPETFGRSTGAVIIVE